MIKVSLTAEDFKTLISGGVVEKNDPEREPVKITLQDIGYETMLKILVDQVEES